MKILIKVESNNRIKSLLKKIREKRIRFFLEIENVKSF